MESVQEKKTALLLFTRSSEEEAVLKDFSNVQSYSTNLQIAENLILQTRRIIRESGIPCFIISSSDQYGKSFGEKIKNAFADVFQLGYENVIAIGNDCPSLTPYDLIKAENDLNNFNAVCGPASDGGLYLIGLNFRFFQQDFFKHLSWESENIAEDFQNYLSQLNASFILSEVKNDIDNNYNIIQTLKNKTISILLRTNLTSLLASLRVYPDMFLQHLISSQIRIYSSLRAPPVY